MKIRLLDTHREQLNLLNKKIQTEDNEAVMFFQGNIRIGARTGVSKIPAKIQVTAEDYDKALPGAGIEVVTALGTMECMVRNKVNPLNGKFYLYVFVRTHVKVLNKEIKFIENKP